MKLKYILFLLFIILASLVKSQQIKEISPRIEGNYIKLDYKISGLKFYDNYDLELFVSFDGGESFKGPMPHIVVDTAKNTITWDVFKDVKSINGDVIFDIKAQINSLPVKSNFFIQYTAGILLSSTDYLYPFGLTFGKLDKLGWYGSLRFNTLQSAKYTYENESLSNDILYEPTNNKIYPYVAFSGGLIYQTNWKNYLTFGLGYASKQYLIEINEYSTQDASLTGTNWLKMEDESEQGFLIEVGTIYTFKRINLSANISTLNLKHVGINGGIGYNF